jgi:hypothetical protein
LKASKNEKLNLIKDLKKSASFYWRVISLKLITFSIILTLLIISIIIYTLFAGISTVFTTTIIIILVLFTMISLFFRKAAMFKENIVATDAIARSYLYFKKNRKLTVLTLLIVGMVNIIIYYVGNFFESVVVLMESNMFFSALYTLVLLITVLWTNLFVFNCYNIKKTKIKKKK